MAQDKPDTQNSPKVEQINVSEKLQQKQVQKRVSQQKKAAQEQHFSRVKGVVPRGPMPGGLQESAAAMADPTYLQQTREKTQQRQQAVKEDRERVGVKHPHRAVDDTHLGAFKTGASGGKVTASRNPNIAARAARFTKGSE